MKKSPDEELAEIVTAALLAAGYVGESHLVEVKDKLAKGSAREEDWRLWIETAVFPRRRAPESKEL